VSCLFTLVLGFNTQRHPDLSSAQVLIQRLPPFSLTVSKRQLFAYLKECLELPINGGTISVTQQQRVKSARLCLAPLVPAIDF